MKDLIQKKALITGAAAGIGRAIALKLAAAGTDLYLLDIDPDGLADVSAQAMAKGVQVVTARCDLTDPQDITRSLDGLIEHWGHVDIVVNNAGIAYYGPTDRMTDEQWDRLLAINLRAPIQITGRLLHLLEERLEAHVLNVCSIAALVAGPRSAAYHVTKFGLLGYTEALRAEYGRRGLGVSAVCPGPVLTKLYQSALSGRKDRTVPEPPAWLCSSADAVAAKAVQAIRKNRRMVLVGPVAHTLWFFKRFTPGLLDLANHLGRRRKLKQKRQKALDAASVQTASSESRRAA